MCGGAGADMVCYLRISLPIVCDGFAGTMLVARTGSEVWVGAVLFVLRQAVFQTENNAEFWVFVSCCVSGITKSEKYKALILK